MFKQFLFNQFLQNLYFQQKIFFQFVSMENYSIVQMKQSEFPRHCQFSEILNYRISGPKTEHKHQKKLLRVQTFCHIFRHIYIYQQTKFLPGPKFFKEKQYIPVLQLYYHGLQCLMLFSSQYT